MRFYPAILHNHEKGGYWATFAQETELTGASQGEDYAEVMEMLDDLLLCNLQDYFDENKLVPDPLPVEDGQVGVPVSTTLEEKIRQHNERIKQTMKSA